MSTRRLVELSLVFAMAVGAFGCSAESPATAPVSSVSSAPPTKVPTIEDWRAAMDQLVVERSVEDKGDGIADFLACLRVDGKEHCGTNFGRRDGFKNVRFFSSGLFASLNSGITAPYLKSYISLPEGEMPIIMFSPVYTGERWLFMNKAALMVDGKVIVERTIPHSDVQRDTGLDYVDESYHFPLKESEVAALRQITDKSRIAIRITGEKGYVSVEKDLIDIFQKDLIELVAMHEVLEKGLRGHTPPSPNEPTPRPAPAPARGK